MAAQDKVTFKQDLTEPVKIRHYEGVVFTGDDCGNLIKVALFDGGVPYSGGGTVSATAILADGTTFPLTHGSITGNMVSVPLEAGALVVSGLMGLYVKISGGGIICTVLNAIFTVQVTDTGRVPAATVTTVNELVAAIRDAQDSIPADLTNLLAAVAPTFSTSTAYSAGAYVWQGGVLYRFTAAHPAGTWTGADAVNVALGNDVADLKSAIIYNEPLSVAWERGSYGSDGNKNNSSSPIYIRTSDQIAIPNGCVISALAGYTYRVYYYTDQGVYDTRDGWTSGQTQIRSGGRITIVLGKSGEAAIDVSENANITIGEILYRFATETEFNDLKDIVDDAGLLEYGEPTGIEWALGTLGSTGNYTSYKNVVRANNAIEAKVGDAISCESGYLIRVYLYNAASSDPLSASFISRSDWVTTYTFDQNCYARIIIGDTTNYTNNQYVLPDTTYSQYVVWDAFLLSNIRDDVTALQTDMQTMAQGMTAKMTGGYVDISELLNTDGGILQGAVGAEISFCPKYARGYRSIAFPVQNGNSVRISGEASADYRLWLFTDTARKIITKSNTFLHEENLVIVAPADGYIVFNALRTGQYTPKIEVWVSNLSQYIDANEKKTNYENISFNHGVLSAFNNIVCCGDSITTSVVYTGETWEGGQVTYQARAAYRRWTQILADRTGANVSYLATGGFTPKVWWETYASRIASADNQLAIIYLGTNGALTDTLDEDAPGMDASQYNANNNTGCYCKIVKAWVDAGARVLLIHVKKGDDLYTTNAVIDKIGDKFGVAVVEVPGLWDNKYHSYPDGSGSNSVHYNDLGYAAFAETLMAAVGTLNETMFLRLCPR